MEEIRRHFLLAEIIQQLLEDEYGSGGAEDDEGLTTKQAEDCPGQGCAQKTLHYALMERMRFRFSKANPTSQSKKREHGVV